MLKQQQHVNVTNIINKQRKEGEVLMGAGSDLMYSSSQMNKISSVFFPNWQIEKHKEEHFAYSKHIFLIKESKKKGS